MHVVRPSERPREPAGGALFTGEVARTTLVRPDDSKNFNFSIVHFGAGVRNKMHSHTSDQLLIVTEGTGTVATEREEREVTTGDIILIPAGENHWHGAPGKTPMSHITVQAKGSTTTQVEP